MPESLLEGVRQLCAHAAAHVQAVDARRLDALEAFRGELVEAFGDEPAIRLLTEGAAAVTGARVSLADYVGTHALARHASVWWIRDDAAVRIAGFAAPEAPWRADGPVAAWLIERGALIPSQVAAAGAGDSTAALLAEMRALDLGAAVPIMVNTELRGLLLMGPRLLGDYAQGDVLRLHLYAAACLAARTRRASGLPSRLGAEADADGCALGSLEDLWTALRPAQPLRVLILDEAPKMVEQLSGALGQWGFAVRGTTTEGSALDALRTHRPQILLIDMTLNRRVPQRLLCAVEDLSPEAIVIGTTSGHAAAGSDRVESGRVARTLTKPFGLVPVVNQLLEAALRLNFSARV